MLASIRKVIPQTIRCVVGPSTCNGQFTRSCRVRRAAGSQPRPPWTSRLTPAGEPADGTALKTETPSTDVSDPGSPHLVRQGTELALGDGEGSGTGEQGVTLVLSHTFGHPG